MKDLFGVDIPEKTFEREYKDYINSASWKHKKEQKMYLAGNCCERCGLSKYSVKLELHHLTYEHFKHEPLDDLQLLCPKCHHDADEERRIMVKATKEVEKKHGSMAQGFERWMDHGDNPGWRRMENRWLEMHWNKFLRYLRSKTGRDFDTPYWRSPDWR